MDAHRPSAGEIWSRSLCLSDHPAHITRWCDSYPSGYRTSVFVLRKWYLDCVSPAGDAFIGYSARLHWGALRAGYGASLFSSATSEVVEAHTFLPGRAPAADASGVVWHCRRLDLRGDWRACAKPARRALLDAAIDWECLVPLATAEVHTPAGHVSGLGYAERLTLNLAPWKLPFHTLHWGRFLTPSTSLVWIVWQGDTDARLLLHDSLPSELAEFSPSRLVTRDGTALFLETDRVLRSGAIVSPTLRSLGRLAKRIPARFLSAREDKWLSRGTLERPGSPPVHGWAIHEVVRFT